MKRAALVPVESIPALDHVVPAWPGEAWAIDGRTTFVRPTAASTPDAEPALYIHGLGGSSLNWTDLAYLLSDRLDGLAIDLPGFGHSDPGPAYGMTSMAARVIRLIEYSGRGPVHLFGNSLGGAISVRVAATRPDLIRTLTLISPAMPFMDPRRSLQARLIPLLFVPGGERWAARRLAAISPELLASQVIAACFAEPERLAPQRLAEAVEEVRRRYEARVHRNAVDQHGARAALPFAASFLGSGELTVLSQHVEETLQRMHIEPDPTAVQSDLHELRSPWSLVASP